MKSRPGHNRFVQSRGDIPGLLSHEGGGLFPKRQRLLLFSGFDLEWVDECYRHMTRSLVECNLFHLRRYGCFVFYEIGVRQEFSDYTNIDIFKKS